MERIRILLGTMGAEYCGKAIVSRASRMGKLRQEAFQTLQSKKVPEAGLLVT